MTPQIAGDTAATFHLTARHTDPAAGSYLLLRVTRPRLSRQIERSRLDTRAVLSNARCQLRKKKACEHEVRTHRGLKV